MKNFLSLKIILSAFAILLVTACSSTHGTFLTEHENVWIDGYSTNSNSADKGLVYCKANLKENGLADPVCYIARFEEHKDEYKKLKKEKRRLEKEREKKEKSK